MSFIKDSESENENQEKTRSLKSKELFDAIVIGILTNNFENLSVLKLKYQLENNQELFETEGMCLLMSKFFDFLTNYEILEKFIGKFSMSSVISDSSLRVHKAFTNLFNLVVVELNTWIQRNDKSGFNWSKHKMMCYLLIQMFEYGARVIIGKNKNKIFEYIMNIVENCEDNDIVRMTPGVFKAFSKNKIESWLMKRLDTLTNELDGNEIVWRKHENMCEVLRKMLEIVFTNAKNRVYYQNLFKQLINLVTEYLVKILYSAELHSQIMLLTILILEMMDLKKILALKWKKELTSKLTEISFSLSANFQLNQCSLDQQISFCIRWCLENLLSANNRMTELPPIKLSPDRFDARNDYFASVPVRSAFGVASGVYYYEVTLLTVGEMFIGWSTTDTLFGEYHGWDHIVGCGKHSIGFATSEKCILHDNKYNEISSMPTLELYDVIGCLIDFDNQRFVFYHNGKCIFDKTIKNEFPSLKFYATVSLAFNQQCHFNFGQHEFKHFPRNIKFKNFHKSTNGDDRKYRLLETENVSRYFWFKNLPVDNHIDLPYTTLEVAQVNQEKENNILKFLKTILYWLELDLNIDGIYVAIFVYVNETIRCDETNKTVYCVKLWELLYPYTQLKVNSTNGTLYRNVCIAMVVVLHIENLSQFIYQTYFEFLLSNKFFSIENIEDYPQLITTALNGLDKFEFREEDRQLLLNHPTNKSLVSTLQWCFQRYGQVDNVSHLYEQNCDFVGLQAGQCAKWFYEKVLSCKESPAVSTFVRQATLNPFDRSLRLKLSSDGLSARSYCNWQSVRSIAYARSDIYYFEVILLTSGAMRIGWATKRTDLNETELGKDKFSVSYDGFNRCVRHDSEVYQLPDMPQWKAGDVIGCLIDKCTKQFSFSLNGRSISLPCKFFFSKLPYHAAISLAYRQQAYFNFGQAKFKYAPEQIDHWSFQLAVEYNMYEKSNKATIDLRHANVTNSLISVNSKIKTRKISFDYQTHHSLSSNTFNFKSNKKIRLNSDHSNLLAIDWNKQSTLSSMDITKYSPSFKPSHSECRLCTESFPTKLLSFVCCFKLTLCLDCAKLQPHCARCSKQGQSEPEYSAIRTLVECRLCFDQTQTRILQFTCCNTISLCLDCLKSFDECSKCKKKQAITQVKHQVDNVISIPYTEEMDKVVSHFMNSVGSDTPSQAIVTCKFTNVFLKDLKTVQDNEWLNDSIVDFYFHLISERQHHGNYPKVHSFPKYVYDFIHSKDNPTQFTKDLNLFDYDILFFPMLKDGHWRLTVVNVPKKVVQYYDSVHNEDRAGVDEIVQFVNKVHFMNRSEVLDEWQIQYRVEGIPKQSNTFDCGVYVCKFAEYISRNAQIDFTQEHISYFRKCIIYEIVTKKLLTN